MKLAELVDTVEWENVKTQPFLNFYQCEETLMDFLLLFPKLSRLDPVESGMRIIIRKADLLGDPYDPEEAEEGEDFFYQIIGKNGTLNKEVEGFEYHWRADDPEFANSEAEYELIYASWEKWMGMEIDEQTLQNFTAPQIVARCMSEMAFVAFDQFEIRQEKERIRQDLEELNAMSAEERKEYHNWALMKIVYEKYCQCE